MTFYDPNCFFLHISRFAAVELKTNPANFELIIRKQSLKKVGGKSILVKTEIPLTLNELEILVDSSHLLKLFLSLAQKSRAIETPPKPPERTAAVINDAQK